LADRQARTLLEQRIRERCLTFEEFVQHAETFARDNREPGTLSLRHLQRLVSGRPLGTLRPATARLLEHIFGEPIAALLAPPKTATVGDDPASELRQLLDAEAWQHYGHSRSTAAESNSIPHESHAAAGQAIALREAGATGDAVDLLDSARRQAEPASPRVLRSWLAATHGETLVAHGDRTASLRAFDSAAELLPCDAADARPYVALDSVHLARWRGQALAQFGEPDAIAVLTDALNRLDPSSVRAEARTRISLATALAAHGDRDEARTHADHATQLATQVGSARLHRRSTTLLATLG
jgi:hypothetical protein